MTREEYIKDCWLKAQQYIEGVYNDKIVVNKWITMAIQRHVDDLNRDDLVYDSERIERVFSFFYFLFLTPKKRFELLPYQAFIIVSLFGFYRLDGSRKYKYAFFWLARKNGKTTFSAALQLYFMIADGEWNPQSILVASTKNQASIALNAASELIQHSPALKKRLEFFGPQDSRNRIVFKDKKKAGFCKSFAPFAERLDGYHPSGAILDEVHTYNDYSLFNVIKSGVGGRENPMILLISTAGFNLDSICFDLVKSGKTQLENPDLRDDSFFYLLYTLDDGDDVDNPECWVKANPALDEIVTMEYLLNEFNQVKLLPVQKPNFLTKHLNIFTEEPSVWVPKEVLVKYFKDLNIDDFEGMDCYIGADFSKVKDFSALTLTFEREGHLYSFPYFFFANSDVEITWRNKYSLKGWVERGFIIQGDKPTIDYDLIYNYVKQWNEKFNIVQFNFDPYNKREIIPKLIQDLGLNCKEFRQTAVAFNDPIKLLETKVYNEEITFQNNPVLLWNFGNIVLYMDGNANVKFMKNKNNDPIDGAVATGMSIGAWHTINSYGRYDLSVFSK